MRNVHPGPAMNKPVKPELSIFAEDNAARFERARLDIESGALIPNDEVCAWLETWGTPDEKPAPDSWFA